MALGAGSTRTKGRKRKTPLKDVILPLLTCLAWKWLQDRHRHAAYHNKHWRRAF